MSVSALGKLSVITGEVAHKTCNSLQVVPTGLKVGWNNVDKFDKEKAESELLSWNKSRQESKKKNQK